ncbi:hypothetical protein LTS10_002858 [Elasticomyces elasticus]|nr:hypothetical protein LTS10_002858 [Elasticomyces elasticus]
MKLHDFVDADSAPKYAILSHRWGDEEVTHKAWRKGRRRVGAKGYVKILDACAFAQARGQAWLWVDTCCIDKESSQDLSESINSMWYYYESAVECYTYLADVTATELAVRLEQFRQSDIFNRGWTLQELIAPKRVIFVSSSWDIMGLKYPPNHSASEMHYIESTGGPKARLTEELRALTRVPADVLADSGNRFKYSVAQRMSWMSHRKTTRIEDMAYCLLGLFDINMPLLYGERQGAFLRLQREILARGEDETMLAWPRELYVESANREAALNSSQVRTQPTVVDLDSGMFASGPHCFDTSDDMRVVSANAESPLLFTGNGVQITIGGGDRSRALCSKIESGLACLFLDVRNADVARSRPPEGVSDTGRVCIYLHQLKCRHWTRTSIPSDDDPRNWGAYPVGNVLLIHYTERDASRHCSQSSGRRGPVSFSRRCEESDDL